MLIFVLNSEFIIGISVYPWARSLYRGGTEIFSSNSSTYRQPNSLGSRLKKNIFICQLLAVSPPVCMYTYYIHMYISFLKREILENSKYFSRSKKRTRVCFPSSPLSGNVRLECKFFWKASFNNFLTLSLFYPLSVRWFSETVHLWKSFKTQNLTFF